MVSIAALTVGPYLVPLPANEDAPAEAFAWAGGRFVHADGTRTWVQEAGPELGSAVVFLHGFGGSTFSWRASIPAMARAGYRAVAFDLRGFGLSDKTLDADYGHAAQARFALGVLDALGIYRAVIVGHSMGGNVASHIALEAPDRVAGLVLVDAATGPDAAADPGGSLASALLRLPPVQRIAQHVLRRLATPDRVSGILRSAYLDASAVSPETAAGYLVPQRLPDWDLALIGIIRDGDDNALGDRFREIAAPTLIVWGARDPWIPSTRGEAIQASLPGSRLVVIPNSGHLPFEERPDAFIGALLPFLESTT